MRKGVAGQLEEALGKVEGIREPDLSDGGIAGGVDTRGYRNKAWLEDYVIATLADETRVDLLRSNRAWRQVGPANPNAPPISCPSRRHHCCAIVDRHCLPIAGVIPTGEHLT